MAVDLNVPTWVEPYIRTWLERLHISHWRIRLKVAMVVQGDEDNRACILVQPEISTATITFRADIEENADWRQTILHELMHICHGKVTDYVRYAVIPETAEAVQNLALIAYKQHMETFINSMADTLYWCTRHRDFPDEYPMDAPEDAAE